MHCYLSQEPRGTWSEIFSSSESLSSFEWVFPDVHVGRLWIAMGSSENELAVDFTVWFLAEWNSSRATRSSIDGNNLPKGSHLRFPGGETLSNCGGMWTLAEILHCLFQTQIHGFLHLVPPQMAPLWEKSAMLSRPVVDLSWFRATHVHYGANAGSSLLFYSMSLGFSVQLCTFFGHNDAFRLENNTS